MKTPTFYQDFKDEFSIWRSEQINFPSHLHTHLEIYYAQKGVLQLTVDSKTHLLKPGEISFAFPGRIHAYDAYGDIASEGIMLICPSESCGDYTRRLFSYHPVTPFLRASDIHPDAHFAMESLLRSTEEPTSTDVLRAYLHLLLARTIPLLTLKKNSNTKTPDDSARIVEYVGEHFCEPLSLETVASALDMSPYHVSRVFSQKLHSSFCSYTNTLRVHRAQVLLLSTQQDILTIAFTCGFETTRTFNRAFKAQFGISAREYRSRLREKREAYANT